MLDRTMVVNAGEFGWTSVINNQADRAHWPNAYRTVVVGSAISDGQVVGSSDWKGGEVEFSAPTVISDRLNRP